jgi:hypothetical protein
MIVLTAPSKRSVRELIEPMSQPTMNTLVNNIPAICKMAREVLIRSALARVTGRGSHGVEVEDGRKDKLVVGFEPDAEGQGDGLPKPRRKRAGFLALLALWCRRNDRHGRLVKDDIVVVDIASTAEFVTALPDLSSAANSSHRSKYLRCRTALVQILKEVMEKPKNRRRRSYTYVFEHVAWVAVLASVVDNRAQRYLLLRRRRSRR